MNHRNCLLVIALWIASPVAAPGAGALFPAALTVESLLNPAGIDRVTAHHDSPQRPIHVKWKRTGDRLHAEVGLPPNTTAEVILPKTDSSGLTESGIPATSACGVHGMTVAGGRATIKVGCGTYRFESRSLDRRQARQQTASPQTRRS